MLLQLFPQIRVLALKLLDSQLQAVHLFFGANAELLDDFEEAPETEDDDQRGDFFENAVEEHVNYEAGDDDEGVEGVKVGAEIAVICQLCMGGIVVTLDTLGK